MENDLPMADSKAQLIKLHATSAKHCCKTKGGTNEVKQDGDSDLIGDSREEFLGTVNTDTVSTNKSWTAVLQLNNRAIEFKVDTGADVTVITKSVYCPNKDGKLEPASIPLNGLTGETLEVCGRCTAHLTRKGVESKREIYVEIWAKHS